MTFLKKKLLLPLLLIALLFSNPLLAKDWQEGVEDEEELKTPHKCTHDEQEFQEPELVDLDEEDLDANSTGRVLQSYPRLRTYGYYDLSSSAPSAYKKYLREDLFPPIVDYFGAALKNKHPISGGRLRISQTRVCGLTTPSLLRNGVNADIVLMIKGESSSSLGWVASASNCALASGSRRPLVAYVRTNRYYMKETSNVLLHEKNMMCAMHEVIHALGFSKSLYRYWKSTTTSSVRLGSGTSLVVSAEPLRTKLRQHFGCSTLRGAYMENSGGSGTMGSHFERRQFANEIMTSGLIYDMQMSDLTLALLESTGWYAADYSYADNYNWGRGQGCTFLTGSSPKTAPLGFCSGSSRGCTASGTSGGSCSTDSRSDNLRWFHPSINYHCENPSASSYARLPSLQSFGRTSGSKCFTGTLSSSSSSSTTSFCFKYSCSGSGSSTRLNLTVGSRTVTCSRAGTVSVSGYRGTINCPNPADYCRTTGKKVCPRGCMGRGTCRSGVCVCNRGFKGKDCALRA